MDSKKILLTIGAVILGIAIAIGCNALILLVVCKLMGWTFSWKWVVLFTIVYGLLKSLLSVKK